MTGPRNMGRPQGVSMLLLALDPTVSTPHETFTARVDDLIDRIHGSRRADDAAELARVPGERAARTTAELRAEGIELPAALIAELRTIATERDIPVLA